MNAFELIANLLGLFHCDPLDLSKAGGIVLHDLQGGFPKLLDNALGHGFANSLYCP